MAAYSGKKAIIIGGSHGIGLSTARLLVDQGAQVLVTGRSPDPIRNAQEQLGDRGRVVSCDITSSEAIAQLVPTTEEYFGADTPIDLVFINAGYAALERFDAVTDASFQKTMDTNVFGAFFVTQKLAPMVRDGGAIVFTTSVANQVGIPGMALYSAAKAAVHSLVQTLAAELSSRRVRVNAVSPGFVQTPTMGVANVSEADRSAFEKEGVTSTPLGRIGKPEEIARAVAFLGFEATFTTGSQIVLDGGLTSLQVHN
ncbi:hypothetical protein EYZ11_013332 [Aspergillus tanneri]|uniref:Ketoreductase domain-containing protein n=1 Tax=Aspergillus tanneri TaxID=1220188 RepID=A0A4S3J3C5_9EURO|nr:uncharacterized protein ATNIH1004_006591 [Aspergillus tanneri]KAA8647889.1 hypothetical protein ATNIH1004_006591 [Aspergillus tanneri]THC87221.1 hypothetical protein EYZ11_013332 [Aspergillus tanneri]